MATICTLIWPELKTPHDGHYVDAELDVDNHVELGGLVVTLVGCAGAKLHNIAGEQTSSLLARLDVADHRLWSLNPGLRQALLDRVRAMTLVRG
jgi:hypothetical protein